MTRPHRYPQDWYRADTSVRRQLIDPATALPATGGNILGHAAIKDLLRQGQVRFAIGTAVPNDPLEWLEAPAMYTEWKTELQPHLVAPDAARAGFSLDDYADGYGYIASRWTTADNGTIIRSYEMRHGYL